MPWTTANSTDVQTLIAGAVNRGAAIRSGRLKYRFETGTLAPGQFAPKQVMTRTLSFTDDRWLERDDAAGLSVLVSGSIQLKFQNPPRTDRRGNYTAVISTASPQIPGLKPQHPLFAGTFWAAKTLEFVKKHHESFQAGMGDKNVAVPCEVCELGLDGKAVRQMLPESVPSLKGGGLLRLHIAPQLGFGLPLIEVCTPNGDKVLTYKSDNWILVSDDVYFPKSTRRECARLPAWNSSNTPSSPN